MAKKKKPILSAKDRLNTIIRNSSKSTPKVGATRTILKPEVISTKPTLKAKPTLRQEPIIARPTVSKPSVVQWIKSKQIIPTIENRINEVENNITNVIPKRVSQATDWAKQTGDRVNEKIIKPIVANQKYHDEKNKGKTAEQRRKEMLDQYKETVTKAPSITPKEAINGIKALPKFVKNSDQVKEANKDGFQAKDIPTYLSATGKTLGDMSLKTMKGMSSTVQGIKNYTKLAAAELSYLIGDSEGSEYFKNQVKTPEYRKGSAEEYLLKKMPKENKDSFLTEKGGQVFEGLGQLVVQGLIFKTAGAKAAYTGLGASAGGNAANQALNDGASLHEAFTYGTGVGAAEVVTEKLAGGIGGAFGKGAVDDYVVGKFTKDMLTDTIAQRVKKAAVQQGIKSFAEGGEEWIAGVAGAAMQKLTYKSEEDIWELIGNQQLMDQFIMGAIVSLAASPGNIASSAKNDIDVVTGFNREQRDQVAKFESKGVDYAKAVELVGTGFTDRHMAMVEHLETTGDTRKQAIDKVTKEVKGEKVYGLTETDYRADSFNAKTTALQYNRTNDKHSNQVLESAGKVANNTTETRQQILNLSKIAQKGKIDVEVVNNQIMIERGRLTQEDIAEGLIKNGYMDTKNDKVVVNIDGADPLSVVLAHEFTHLTENKTEYKLLHDGIVAEYTKNGTYKATMEELRDMYMKKENIKEIKDLSDADIQLLESELVANEVGKLFKDQAYIEKFASEQPGLFRKAYQVVKGMLVRVTKGSKEADYLTKLKQNFESVAKAKSKVVSKDQKNTDSDVKFSMQKDEIGSYINIDTNQNIFFKVPKKGYRKVVKSYIREYYINQYETSDNILVGVGSIGAGKYSYNKIGNDVYEVKMRLTPELLNVIKESEYVSNSTPNKADAKFTHYRYYKIDVKFKELWYEGTMILGLQKNGEYKFYDVDLKNNKKRTSARASVSTLKDGLIGSNNNISPGKEDVKQSISKDSKPANKIITPPIVEKQVVKLEPVELKTVSIDTKTHPLVAAKIQAKTEMINTLATEKAQTVAQIEQDIKSNRFKLQQKRNPSMESEKLKIRNANLRERQARIEAEYDARIDRTEKQVDKLSLEETDIQAKRKDVITNYYTHQAAVINSVEFKKDKKIGLFYETESLTRNFFDIMKTPAMAQKMVDEYVLPVKDSNAAINKQAMKLNETVLALGLNKQEAIYTMMLREIRLNPDTKLTDSKVKAHLRENVDKIDVAKVEKAIPVFTKIYEDLFKQVNEVLVEHGYKPMPYRKGYTPHYQGFGDSKMAKLMKTLGVKYQDETLPIQISGLTGDFSPGKTFNVNALERKGDITEYNILEGYDLYLKSALDVIHHTKNIHKLRALESAIRTIGSEGSFKKALNANIAKAKELNEDGELFDEDGNRIDMQDAINETLKQINNKGQMKNFINLIHEHTNLLANKQSELDRIVEKKITRFGLTAFKAINAKVGANMIVGNLGSAISNSVVLQQTSAFVSPLSMAQATAEARGAAFRISQEIKSFSEDSTFLTNRFFENKGVWKTKLDKASDIASAVFEATDTTTSYIAVRARYLDNIKAGLNHAEAIKEADAFADNLIAARDKGSVPVLFRSATAKGFTQFQLEVNNQLRVFFKDAFKTMPLRYKEKLLKGLFAGFLKYMITAFIFNKFTRATVGRPIAFSPIDIGFDFYKTSQDDELNTSEKVDEMGNRILQELPYIGSFLGGGRMPISAALPDIDKIKKNQDLFGTTIPEILKSFGAYVVMPFGGGQLKKSIEGGAQYFKDIPGSYTDKGQLRFEADTSPMGVIQSIVFGQWASKKAQDYFENNRRPITEKQLKEVKAGNTTVDKIQMKREIDKLKKQTAEKDKANAEKGIVEKKTTEKDDGFNIEDTPLKVLGLFMKNNEPKKEVELKTVLEGRVDAEDIELNYYKVYSKLKEIEALKDKFDDDLSKEEVNVLIKERKLDYLATLKEIKEEDKDKIAQYVLEREDSFDVSEYDKYASVAEYDYATKNPTEYKLITSISSFDQYNVMKDNIDKIRKVTPEETRPQAVYDYLVKTKTSKVGRAMMMREYYSSYKTHNKAILDFIDKMDATGQEKIMMADRLKFKVKDWEWYLWN